MTTTAKFFFLLPALNVSSSRGNGDVRFRPHG